MAVDVTTNTVQFFLLAETISRPETTMFVIHYQQDGQKAQEKSDIQYVTVSVPHVCLVAAI